MAAGTSPFELRQKRGTEALYDSFRTGFSHDLGLLLESGPVDHRGRIRAKFRMAGRHLGVTKQPSLSPALLVELDDVTVRPNWLGPTVVADGKVGLLVDAVALYWGVRRLVFDHTSKTRAVSSLDKMIEDSWKRRKAAGLIVTIEGRESGELLVNGKPTSVAALRRRLGSRRRRH